MKVLITGATGFIGHRVLEQLKLKKIDVIALSNSDGIEGIKTISSRHYQFDDNYLLKHGCEDIEILIHIGAWTPKTNASSNDLEKSYSNIANTRTLLKSKMPTLRQIIYCSTLDVYENTDSIIDERTITVPSTMYGWSKLYCEKMIRTFCANQAYTYQILRIGHVYGEGEEKYRKVMPVMIENAIRGNDLTIYGDGKAIRTFIYIEDVAKAIVNALMRTQSDIINIVGNEAITINELADAIKNNCGNNININHVSTDILNRNCIFDNSKLMHTLLQELTPFKVGLKKEMEYMKEQINR